MDQFTDANNNKVIDAGESFALQFTIENQGKGDAYNIRIRLAEQQGYDQYFDGPRELTEAIFRPGSPNSIHSVILQRKSCPRAWLRSTFMHSKRMDLMPILRS